jgi:hypothetical protein
VQAVFLAVVYRRAATRPSDCGAAARPSDCGAAAQPSEVLA